MPSNIGWPTEPLATQPANRRIAPEAPWRVARHWPDAELHLVRSGHTGNEEMSNAISNAYERWNHPDAAISNRSGRGRVIGRIAQYSVTVLLIKLQESVEPVYKGEQVERARGRCDSSV
jgi:hypothetical protein